MVAEWIAKYWVGWLNSLLAALIALLYRRVVALKKEAEARRKEEEKNSKALQDAMVALMRDRIRQSCRYHLRNGFVSTEDLDTLTDLYNAYHALGGNSTTTEVFGRVKALPINIEELH